MICLGNIYDDLAFRTTVYNTVRNINDTPPPPPPDGYSNENAVVEEPLLQALHQELHPQTTRALGPLTLQQMQWEQHSLALCPSQ